MLPAVHDASQTHVANHNSKTLKINSQIKILEHANMTTINLKICMNKNSKTHRLQTTNLIYQTLLTICLLYTSRCV